MIITIITILTTYHLLPATFYLLIVCFYLLFFHYTIIRSPPEGIQSITWVPTDASTPWLPGPWTSFMDCTVLKPPEAWNGSSLREPNDRQIDRRMEEQKEAEQK